MSHLFMKGFQVIVYRDLTSPQMSQLKDKMLKPSMYDDVSMFMLLVIR